MMVNLERRIRSHRSFLAIPATAVLFFTGLVVANEKIMVGNFSRGDFTGWEEKSFQGNSQYSIIETSAGKVLQASTEGNASGMFRQVDVDLLKTPWINWSWKIENTFKDNNEHRKEGDDYPARVYVVVSGGILFWKTRAVNYVWSSHEPVNSDWPNAFTDHARMVAVRSGDEQARQWLTEKRNVREDLKKYFGKDINHIDAIAVMVDGDNTGQSATAYYGDIFFSEN